MPFEFVTITPGVTRCSHRGKVTLGDSRQLRSFLCQYRGKLLVDLAGTSTDDLSLEFLRVRSMLPQTAFYGGALSPLFYRNLAGKHVYLFEARHFETEAEALSWLGGEPPEPAYFVIDPSWLQVDADW
jgi:hypothetical protein